MKSEQHRHFAALARAVAERADRQAFTELFDHFAPRIKSYLQGLSLEGGQAEEVTQEVMVVLWHKAALFDPAKSSLGTWLFRVARNRRIDLVRRDKSGLLDPEDPIFRPEEADPADQMMDAEQRDGRVREALRDLPAEQLELVRKAFYLGLSHSQIAEETGLPLGTVKSRIRLAFARLRKALDQDDMVDTDF
ncbi:sigma-70 family RNA polymerase sigma factor [Oricola cellulosilytica]|uniref:Sigma-70 family RNA polymerase sigma factor n=1 Tax=Oricola cellulosilytica TaxID=1429082 RepID=A0A4R0PAC2_9HYPH|nr:sigma-70 family RNA polymerase sigma factor [Oricola cellulosilytica]TCD13875.1 sigma-70 family RNA polymerase sigma factor [Oricola cellulosilytica]